MFVRYSKRVTWIILTLCSLVWWITVGLVSTYLFSMFNNTITPLHHCTISFIFHIILFVIIQVKCLNWFIITKALKNLCYVSLKNSIGLRVGGWGVQVPSWLVSYFLSLNSFQYYPNEFDRRGLEQKNNNLINYIFGNFDLMLWW